MDVTAQIEELTKEGISKNEHVMYLKTKMNGMNGNLYLTPTRVALVAKSFYQPKGFLEKFIAKKMNKEGKEEMVFNLPISEIKEIKQGKHGINKNVLEITDPSGSVFRLTVKKFAEWEELLSSN